MQSQCHGSTKSSQNAPDVLETLPPSAILQNIVGTRLGYDLISSRRIPEHTILSTLLMDGHNSPLISHIFMLAASDKCENYIGKFASLPNVVVTVSDLL